MEEVEIGLRDISINCLENSIRTYFKEEIKNISYDRRLINSFQYFGQGESDSIVINVRLKVGDSYTAYEDCDFAKLSIAGSTNVIEKSVLDVTNVKIFARISKVEFKYEEYEKSYIDFQIWLTRKKVKPESLQW